MKSVLSFTPNSHTSNGIFSCQSPSPLASNHRTQIAPYFGQTWPYDPACNPQEGDCEVNASICSPNKLSF